MLLIIEKCDSELQLLEAHEINIGGKIVTAVVTIPGIVQ